MQEATCNRCGASLVFSAKFCRQCGNRLDDSDDPSELTTRTLEEPPTDQPPYDHATRPANAGITSPTYPPPAMFQQQPPPLAPIIGSAPPASNNTALYVILGVIMALLIGLGVVAFVALNRRPAVVAPPPPPPDAGQTEKGMPPPRPDLPQPPPAPPSPPGEGKTSLDPSLIYPGAKVVMDIGGSDGRVTQLHTTDGIDKVVSWYLQRVKVKNDVTMPGGRIISAEGVNLLITSTGDGTSIMVTREGKGNQ
jgi:hypothetical protein